MSGLILLIHNPRLTPAMRGCRARASRRGPSHSTRTCDGRAQRSPRFDPTNVNRPRPKDLGFPVWVSRVHPGTASHAVVPSGPESSTPPNTPTFRWGIVCGMAVVQGRLGARTVWRWRARSSPCWAPALPRGAAAGWVIRPLCYALAFRRAQQTEGRHDFIQKGCLLTITTALKRREPTARCH